MTVVLFYGEKDVGKTTKCRQLHDLLCLIPHAVIEFYQLKDSDFKSKITINNLSVSIYSAGDDPETLKESVEWANLCDCDYHLGAVRKNTKYNDLITQFKTTEDIIWISLKTKHSKKSDVLKKST